MVQTTRLHVCSSAILQCCNICHFLISSFENIYFYIFFPAVFCFGSMLGSVVYNKAVAAMTKPICSQTNLQCVCFKKALAC